MNQFTPPKVGYILKQFPRLSETFILNELLELHRLGTAIQIFSLSDPDASEPAAMRHGLLAEMMLPVIYLPSKPALKKGWRIKQGRYGNSKPVEKAWKDLCKGRVPKNSICMMQAALVGALAEAQGIGHLHAHFATSAASVALMTHRLTRIPFSFTAHAKDIYDQNVDRAMLQRKICDARFVVTVSEANRNYLTALAGNQCSKKIMRLYNGIDLHRFQENPAVCREPDLIVAVGRLEEKKGFTHLIQACRILRDAGQSFRCLIIGEGPEHGSLGNQIESSGLQSQVTLGGARPQEQLLETLKRATVFVLPCVIGATGDRDALPTVLLEALAVGLPAISTDLDGIAEIIEDRHTGLLAPPGDAAALARAIAEMLNHPELRNRLSRAGRLKAEETFDLHKNVPVLRELFARGVAAEPAASFNSTDLNRSRAPGGE